MLLDCGRVNTRKLVKSEVIPFVVKIINKMLLTFRLQVSLTLLYSNMKFQIDVSYRF